MTITTASPSCDPGIREAAAMFGVDPQTIRRYIANQKLNAYRVGPRLIRVRRDEKFDALLTPIGGAA